MNYDNIANLVYDYVRNPKMLLAQNSKQGNTVKSNEFTAIQKVLSDHSVSGGTVLITASPMEYWV